MIRSLFVVLVFPVLAYGDLENAREASVTIKAQGSQGSGLMFKRGDHTFVWTAAHVVDGNKSSDGKWKDCSIYKRIVDNGREVGSVEMLAKIIKYSEEHDLALLKVYKSGYGTATSKFWLGKKIPEVGSKLFHVGSLYGTTGAASLTDGIVSRHGVMLDGHVFDQTNAVAFPGSSGGGIFDANGVCIGMLVRGHRTQGFNLFVPVRRMIGFAKEYDVMWALDCKTPLPKSFDFGVEKKKEGCCNNADGSKKATCKCEQCDCESCECTQKGLQQEVEKGIATLLVVLSFMPVW